MVAKRVLTMLPEFLTHILPYLNQRLGKENYT